MSNDSIDPIALQSNESNPISKSNKKSLIPATKWNEYHDYPSIGGLRHLIFHAEKNGFHKCIRRIGRRVLIDEDRYFEWVEDQNVSQ